VTFSEAWRTGARLSAAVSGASASSDATVPAGAAVDFLESACCERALAEPSAVADQRVRERDERIEDQRVPARCLPRCRQVEVAGVADDEGVGIGRATSEQTPLRQCELQRA